MNGEWLEAETDTDIDLSTIFIPSGSQLPTTPEFTGGAWATYSWDVPQYNANAYVRLQWSYSGSRLGNLEPVEDGSNPQWKEPSYSMGDLSIGMRNDSWEASIFLNNITDERVHYTHAVQGGYTQQNVSEGRMRVETIYTNRPREFGVRFIRHFGD
jgi:outer membrane receptor protein involved in Fe transport